jgi:hypothetical protein
MSKDAENQAYLQPHVIWHQPLLDETPDKVEVRVTSSWICDFDFLEAAFDEVLKKHGLLLDGHWVGQRLVSVT